jgi:hypothetical protein
MISFINWIPVATTFFSILFFYIMLRHYQQKPTAIYLLWWTIGIACYGAGTLIESMNTVFGWTEWKFKAWYITGALLGGWPLATGSVYLLFKKRTANVMTIIGLTIIVTASILTILSPINQQFVDGNRLTGKVLEWKFVRYITPFINTYAFIFLVGGAVYSAIRYIRSKIYKARFIGNLAIAIGGLLPGIGGTYSKMGMTEVLYVTEFIGLLLIFYGYNLMKNDRVASIHINQQVLAVE